MAALETTLTAPNSVTYTQPLGLFINNEWVAPKKGGKIQLINPVDGSLTTSVWAASAEDIDVAVATARKAFKTWRDVPGADRQRLLNRLADLLEEHSETLATITTWENGKPYKFSAMIDATVIVKTFRYYAGWAEKISGSTNATLANKFVYTIREPIGVCGAIIPWNYPLPMSGYKLGPALAGGNTVVLKLAEQAPLSMLYVASLIKQAGFPPGVVNIVNGIGKDAGAALASHPDVDKISFTGSTVTGKDILKMAAVNMKEVTIETGGKSPLIVFDDADLEQAVKYGHMGFAFNSGQNCTSSSRIFLHEKIHDKFIDLLIKRISAVNVLGDPFAAETYQGPQVTKAQFEKVLGYIDSGVRDGATVVYGGKAWKSSTGKGFFVEPTIFTNVRTDSRVYREEIFGPVTCISSFRTEEEAVEKANDTSYGLAAAVFTEDLRRAHRVARRVESGTVFINNNQDQSFDVVYGGFKQSGVGKEGGLAGLEAYTVEKAIHVNMGQVLP